MGTNVVTIKDPKTNKEISYFLEPWIKKKFDEKILPDIQKKDKDCIIAFDGKEGCSPKGTKVLLSNREWKNIEDIKVGDELISPQRDGTNNFSKVISLFEYKKRNTYYVIDYKTKKILYSCSENHYIPIIQNKTNEYQAVELFQFKNPIKTFKYNIKTNKQKIIEVELIKSIKKDVFGFTVDSSSHWYITDNYCITRNSGKTTIALQWCKYVDPSFNLNRICFTPEEFRETVYRAKKNQAIMFDEAFTGFSSRASLSGVNRTLISLMMQVRQKNLFIAIILPTVFLLDKYISLFRTRVLVHIYEVNGRRGFFKLYSSRKKRLLLLHKDSKVYSYGVNTTKRGRFYGVFALGEEEEVKYKKKKEEALKNTEHNAMSGGAVKYREQRDLMIYILRKTLKLSYKKIEGILNDFEFDISYVQIRNICAKFGEKETKEDEQDIKNKKKDLEEEEVEEEIN